MYNKLITAFLIFSFIGGVVLISRSFRVSQIPNGNVNSCANCHVSEFGGGARNDFGKLVETRFLTSAGASGNVVWGPLLASLDADNDGVTNGQELQDPYGAWSNGSQNPGNSSLVSLPGNSNDTPLSTLTINFSSMGPHVNQTLWLRVIDKSNGKEVGRTSTTITESFSLNLDAVIPGNSYYVDFFADHNGNGRYDSPPTDHTWRLELDNAQGNDVLNFGHNTSFSELNWEYLLTIDFTGMTPHVGQLLEVRVEDDLTQEEVGRTRIEFIPSADFSVDIPGLDFNKEYKVEFYADLNENGIYDEPPTDHAWELQVQNPNGDVTTSFTHNTSFTDVGWKYLYTLNLLAMTPHVGQMLELRIYDSDNSEEVGRVKVESIAEENISVSIPQIEIEHDYTVDFYADLNQNGSYDSPPTDHAWRLSFNSSTGNFVENFSHNTNFTDIQWPPTTSVEDEFVQISYTLSQNYPNPFNPTTNISFSIPNSGEVSLKIFDILGREVATILNRNVSAGQYTLPFDASNLESGVYLYRLQSENFSETKKMILVK